MLMCTCFSYISAFWKINFTAEIGVPYTLRTDIFGIPYTFRRDLSLIRRISMSFLDFRTHISLVVWICVHISDRMGWNSVHVDSFRITGVHLLRIKVHVSGDKKACYEKRDFVKVVFASCRIYGEELHCKGGVGLFAFYI